MLCSKCGKGIPDDALLCCYCGKKIQAATRSHRRGNGQGSVYKRADTGTWTAKITLGMRCAEDGSYKLVRKAKSGFRTKKEALEYIAQYKGGQIKTVPTIAGLWEQFKAGGLQTLSESKRQHYELSYKRLYSIEFRKIDSLTIAELQAAVNSETETYYPARDMRDLLVHLYELAHIDGFVNANIARHIVLPPLEEQVPVPFTAEEQKKLWNDYAIGNWQTGYMLLMIYSSMMPIELRACKKSMIDFENKCIVGAGRKTKIRKQESIVLADIIIPVIRDLCERTKGEYLLEMSKFVFYYYFAQMKERLQLRDELSAYSCRHTTATALAMADINPAVIQRVMRHSNFNTTQKYIHLAPNDAVTAVNKI